MIRIVTALVLLTGLGAGAAGAQLPGTTAPDSGRVPRLGATLTQNDIAILLSDDDLSIRFVPLDPRVTSLLAADAAASLQGIITAHRAAIDSASSGNGVSEPGLALVTFFGRQNGVRFDPQLLTLVVRTQLQRPFAIIPLSGRFGSQQLDLRQAAMAIYLFDQPLPVNEPFTVSYGDMTSDDWANRIPLLDRERARLGTQAR